MKQFSGVSSHEPTLSKTKHTSKMGLFTQFYSLLSLSSLTKLPTSQIRLPDGLMYGEGIPDSFLQSPMSLTDRRKR